MTGRVALAGLALVGAMLLQGCSSWHRGEFPNLGAISDADALRLLRARTCRMDTITASMTITYVGPEATGTFDAVGIYSQGSESLRVQAYKDLVVTIEPIFDLVFTPDAYGIESVAQSGSDRGDSGESAQSGETIVAHGDAADFVRDHADLATFFWVREAFCLPGALGSREARVSSDPGRPESEVWIDGVLSSGARVRWIAERSTLRITRATIATPAGVSIGRVDYDESYRDLGGAFLPERAVYQDGQRRIEFVLSDAEFDLGIDSSGLLDPDDVGGVFE